MEKNQIILIIVGVLILIGLVFGLSYYLKIIKLPFLTPEKEIHPLCVEFPEIKGEISCQEAIDKVLEEYPGEVKYIKKTKDFLPAGILPDVQMVGKEVWLIGINLKLPMIMHEIELKSMEIFVIRETGELEINRVMSGEI